MTTTHVGHFLAYIRVSTAKQGERGVSLQEQRDAITRYAQRQGLTISSWFEERETAAKRGRPVFASMLKLLRQRKADGLIVHKIDRSARNLKDWADIGDLIDQGIVVHFANESLDLQSRGGRLSADIQAVVAADYIRNLREETRKGFYGRIKQGLYPLPAPLGYLDKGKGKPKEIDPVMGPLVKKVFELYATGRFNLHGLQEEMCRLGLRNKRGKAVMLSGLSLILNNPFYMGLIRLKQTGEMFSGAHQPLIGKSLFDRVQRILTGKTNTRAIRHEFLFRRLLMCKHCGYSLIGERQKGHVYYRCHTNGCPTKAVREELVEDAILQQLDPLRFTETEWAYLAERVGHLRQNWMKELEDQTKVLKLKKGQLQDRLARLTDAFIDQLIEKSIYEERKASLLLERAEVEEQLNALRGNQKPVPDRIAECLELANDAYSSYKVALPEDKRDLLKLVTSNCTVDGKIVVVTLSLPFEWIARREKFTNGVPQQDRPRTVDGLLEQLTAFFHAHAAPMRLGV